MANEKVLEGLQTIVTDLAQQADGHALQSRIFASEGFTKLAEKYAEHAVEERGWVDKCIDRLLDLGCEVKLEAKKEGPVYKDPVEWVKYDLEVSKNGLAWLKEITELSRDDYTTYDILKAYYQEQGKFKQWLGMLTANVCRDYFRSKISREQSAEIGDEEVLNNIPDTFSQEKIIDAKQRQKIILLYLIICL